MKVDIEERVLHFKQPAGTSRGVYTERKIWLGGGCPTVLPSEQASVRRCQT